jgi:hypothetical protein
VHAGLSKCVGATIATRVEERLGVLLADLRQHTRREMQRWVGELREEKEALKADGGSGQRQQEEGQEEEEGEEATGEETAAEVGGQEPPPGTNGAGEGERSRVRAILLKDFD